MLNPVANNLIKEIAILWLLQQYQKFYLQIALLCDVKSITFLLQLR